jgi:hypothetical protein
MRIAGIVAAGWLAAAGVGVSFRPARAAEAPWGTQVAEPGVLLGRLHRAALHEVQLGQLAAERATTPEARRYGSQLAEDFSRVDQRILSLAAGLGISEARLQVGPGENTARLEDELSNYRRLATESGPRFERDFWVTVADAQARESDLLAVTVNREPALADLAAEMGRLYERSSRRALDAAEGATGAAPEPPPQPAR